VFTSYAEQLIGEINKMPEEQLPIFLGIARLFREGVTLKSAETSFRKGWEEAFTGETTSVSELWDGIDAK
jgi:hypothetical protein